MNIAEQVEEFVISDPEAARELLKRETRRFMMPFMDEGRAVQDVAEELMKDEKQVRNKVAKLKNLGLLVEIQGADSGRIKRYTAAGRCFSIPFGVTPFVSLKDMMVYLSNWDAIFSYYEPILNNMFSGNWFMKLYPVEHEPFLNAEFYNDAPPAQPTSVWFGSGDYMTLSYEDAEKLAEELAGLKERYLKLSDQQPGRQEYFLHLQFVPRPSTD